MGKTGELIIQGVDVVEEFMQVVDNLGLNQDPDAVEIGALYSKARASIIDSVRYQIECGRRLAAKKEGVGHGNWLPWLEANKEVLGFESVRTADRLMQAYRNHAVKLDAGVQFDETLALEVSQETWGHTLVRGTFGTGQNEWFTPPDMIELARKVLGEIDLDPASCDDAQKIVGAKRYFTAADNGLQQEWHGRVWLNPPYTMMAEFTNKLRGEIDAGRVTTAIMLTHNYTDTIWFQDSARYAKAICFKKGRVYFLDPDGDKADPTQGQAFFYFGDDYQTFKRVFLTIGFVGKM